MQGKIILEGLTADQLIDAITERVIAGLTPKKEEPNAYDKLRPLEAAEYLGIDDETLRLKQKEGAIKKRKTPDYPKGYYLRKDLDRIKKLL